MEEPKGSSPLWTPFRAIGLVTTAYNARVFMQEFRRHSDKFSQRNIHVDIFQIVHARAAHDNFIRHIILLYSVSLPNPMRLYIGNHDCFSF